MSRKHAYWACQIGGWTLLVVFRIVLSYFFREVTWGHVLFNVILGTAGLVFTHLYRLVAKRRGWTHLSLKQLIPRVVLAALVLATLTHVTCDLVGRHLLELSFYEEIESEVGLLLASVVNGWILFMLWSVIYFGVHAVWNYRQAEVDKWKLEAQAETARLKALNPHFFFNSLNSVRALIAEDPDRAQRMVTRLARLLRNTLQVDDVKTVPLKEELSTVRTYLELESVRFEDRLRYEMDASDAALNRSVPFLLVQTLTENGIK
ncbi:MAG: sensor histidine kinase, partial [Salinibacter sp.]